MSILDDLIESEPKRGGAKCQCGESLKDHPDLADELAEAYALYDFSARQISEVVAKYGVKVAVSSVARHRRGDCACR